MKRLLVMLATVALVGCSENKSCSGWSRGDLVSCGAVVTNGVVVVAIEDFKYSAGNERVVSYSFQIVNKTNGLATYDGMIIIKGETFSKKIPLMGVLIANEKKPVNEKYDIGYVAHDVEVDIVCEGTQVRQ